MTRRRWNTALSALIVGALFFGLGCGLIGDLLGGLTEESVEGVVERLIEKGLPEDLDLPTELLPGEAEQLTELLPEEVEPPTELLPEDPDFPTDLLPGAVTTWPDWAPAFLPIYEYGDILVAYGIPDQGGGSLIFTNLQLARDPFGSYVRELEQNGWVEEVGWEFPEEEGQAIVMTGDGYWLQYVVTAGDDAGATLTIFADAD